jgi:hypothetical protein
MMHIKSLSTFYQSFQRRPECVLCVYLQLIHTAIDTDAVGVKDNMVVIFFTQFAAGESQSVNEIYWHQLLPGPHRPADQLTSSKSF